MEAKNKKICDYMNGNKLEIEKVMKDYMNYVYAIINKSSLKLSKEDIEEIHSDVFLTLWRNQQILHIDNNMSSYIGGITKNLIKQKYRHVTSDDNILDYEEKLVSISNIELTFSNNEQNMLISNELEKMKTEDKQIFILYYYENKSIKEISTMLSLSKSKVKITLFRIRKKLQKVLEESGYGFNG